MPHPGGEPGRPCRVLVAHRLLREYHQLEPAIRQMGLEVVFESRAIAVQACIMHDTDPDGYNNRWAEASACRLWKGYKGGQHGAWTELLPPNTLASRNPFYEEHVHHWAYV